MDKSLIVHPQAKRRFARAFLGKDCEEGIRIFDTSEFWNRWNGLSERNQALLIYRFGLIDNEPHTQRAIALHFEVSRQRAGQIEQRCLKRLRAGMGLTLSRYSGRPIGLGKGKPMLTITLSKQKKETRMRRFGVRTVVAVATVMAATAALGAARWAGNTLYYNGKAVSNGLITRNGVTYVPLKDMAAALSMTVQPRGDGFALVHPGGGTQMQGLNGKIGDDLFNGLYRLKVLNVTRAEHYKRHLSPGGDIDAPDGQDVVAVAIRLKNGTPKTQFVEVFGNPASLTDEEEHAYDFFTGDSPARNVSMLPGSAVDAVLTFLVPKNAVLKDLVYKVDCPTSGQPFRVSLKQP